VAIDDNHIVRVTCVNGGRDELGGGLVIRSEVQPHVRAGRKPKHAVVSSVQLAQMNRPVRLGHSQTDRAKRSGKPEMTGSNEVGVVLELDDRR
jgi:hypothetical protein